MIPVFWCELCNKPPETIIQLIPDYDNACIPYLVKCHGQEERGSISMVELSINAPMFVSVFPPPKQLELPLRYPQA
jgi:hypothetical protein